MSYIEEDGQAYRPYMIHRALMGSVERFFGVLIEHFGGAFPVWLSPLQAVVIPIADRHVEFAKEIAADLKQAGIRLKVDDRSDRMNAKIRDAEKQKTPFMLVIGDREMEENQVDVRRRSRERVGAMSVEGFRDLVLKEVEEKK
jgi:threonyl-tRNA synthetase